MTTENDNYWTRANNRRSRRSFLRAAALAGAGLTGAAALACKPGSSSGGSKAGGQTEAPRGQTKPTLIGRNGTDAKGETPVMGGTYNYYLSGNPASLDPHLNVSVNTIYTASAVLSRLFRFKAVFDVDTSNNKELQPDLAVSAESPDALTWTVKLRPDAKFQNVAPVNGHAVEPEDIKQTFIKALSPASANRGQLSMIDPAKIEAPSKDTIVFKLNYPYAPFQRLLTSGVYSYIMPREAVAGAYDPAKKIIGSGPFTFDSYTPDVAIVFKKNPDYFEKGRPYVDAVKATIVPDPAQRLAQFTGGHLDWLNIPSTNDVPTMTQSNPKAEIIRNWQPGDGIMYYQLSEKSSIFQDIRVRQAASLAIDRDAYGKALLDGQFIQGFNVGQTMGKWAMRMEDLPADTQQWYKFDLPRAKALMQQAGGDKLTIKMIDPAGAPPDPFLGLSSEVAFNMLGALPWKISYLKVDYNKDWINGGKGYGYGFLPPEMMAWWGLSTRTDIDEYIYGFWHSKSTGNISKLNDPTVDSMIEKARTIVNDDDRLAAYKDIQRYLLAQNYSLTGNPNGIQYQMVQPRVRNFTVGDPHGVGTSNWGQLWLKQ
jgi:peptide/nickel transport system substrate-binding protein